MGQAEKKVGVVRMAFKGGIEGVLGLGIDIVENGEEREEGRDVSVVDVDWGVEEVVGWRLEEKVYASA